MHSSGATTVICHSQACQDQWSMELQVCICGVGQANRELATKRDLAKKVVAFIDDNAILLEGDKVAAELYRFAVKQLN